MPSPERPGGAPVEFDLPRGDRSDDEVATTYDGKAGVPIGNIFSQLLYAVRFSEPNLLLSSRVHENSKILYDRNPRQMVEKVAPWLTVDSDPYPAVVDGRIQWILDGYTVTDKYPLSQRESLEEMTDDSLRQAPGFQTLPTDEINYVRNAVKATVDAYDGTVRLYAWDEEDPILQAWRKVFPGVVESIGWGVDVGETTAPSGLPTIRPPTGWLREAQRFPVRVRFETEGYPKGIRYGSQASVIVYTGTNPVMDTLGRLWIRVASWLSYLY